MFPRFIENSKVPVWLSNIAPINIGAISFGLWVWCRGAATERLRLHETIHYRQQVELLFVGQWILYGLFWLFGFFRYKFDGAKAYRENLFEREAYSNEGDPFYLKRRKFFAWARKSEPFDPEMF
jgi:hypothetical protein